MSVKDFKGYYFESDVVRTAEYIAFEKQCRKELSEQCKNFGFKIHKFNPKHFEWSAVLEKGGEYVYVSLSDVRSWKNWYDNVLIRTMKHETDWTGEENNKCSFNEIGTYANILLEKKLKQKILK